MEEKAGGKGGRSYALRSSMSLIRFLCYTLSVRTGDPRRCDTSVAPALLEMGAAPPGVSAFPAPAHSG